MKLPCRLGDGVNHDDGFISDKVYEARHLERRKGYETPLKDIPDCEPESPGDDPEYDDGPQP